MHPLVIAAALALPLGVLLLIYGLAPARHDMRRLVASNLQRGEVTNLREITLSAPTRERAVRPLITMLSRVGRRFTPAGSIAGLERKYVLAGRPAAWSLERLLAAKVAFGIVGALLVTTRISTDSDGRIVFAVVVLAVLLYFAPDVFISSRAAERQRAILHDLPDALDQMTICMEAGLGFEAAMARVSQGNTDPLAQELIRMLQEIQVGVSRRQALNALVERNDVGDLRHFVTSLIQAESYGVPIAQVLKDQADELRQKRRQRAEEAARKLPLKLLIPLVLFILPPLFVVLLGPAAIAILNL